MKPLHILLILLSVFLVGNAYAGGISFSLEQLKTSKDSIYDDLASKELRKFKYFEQHLESTKLSQKEWENQLTGYARDSLRILKVKLVAIKVLDERNLLNHDIAENSGYYIALLKELRESDIPSTEYVFLEEKLAYLNQDLLKHKLEQSRWLNIGLVALILILGYSAFHLYRKQRKLVVPELSKQETLVCNLILEGKSNKEIANELFISLSTVKSHITNIYSKLNVASRRELLKNSMGTST